MPDATTTATWTLIAAWLIKELWPFVRDRLYPDLAQSRTVSLVEAREREDRLLRVLENNTAAMTALQVTSEAAARASERTATAMQELAEDLEGLRAQLRVPRPARKKESPPDVVA